MPLLKGLKRSHEVVTACYAVGNDALGYTRCDGAFDYGGYGVHGAYDFGLELRWDVEFDLLEEVFRSAEAANDEDVLLNCHVS